MSTNYYGNLTTQTVKRFSLREEFSPLGGIKGRHRVSKRLRYEITCFSLEISSYLLVRKNQLLGVLIVGNMNTSQISCTLRLLHRLSNYSWMREPTLAAWELLRSANQTAIFHYGLLVSIHHNHCIPNASNRPSPWTLHTCLLSTC